MIKIGADFSFLSKLYVGKNFHGFDFFFFNLGLILKWTQQGGQLLQTILPAGILHAGILPVCIS